MITESMSALKIMLKYLLYLVAFLFILCSSTSCRPIKSLGKNPSGEAVKALESLPNYKDGQFQNLFAVAQPDTVISSSRRPRWLYLLRFLFAGQKKELLPNKTIPVVDTDLNARFQQPTIIWFGHSAFLIKTATANILVDPNLSDFAGPMRGSIRAYKGTDVYTFKDMPVIDALVISHDHYDHLDYLTVKRLKKKVKRVIVPVGVGSHFIHWGYDPAMVTELNWNESYKLNEEVIITATPAHHRSNRTLVTRKTLWASYVINADGYKMYYSGDTGYSPHFKVIGDQYGPFDLALMECGSYNVRWPQSHMFPPQIAQAAVDLGAKMTMPVHWGKFLQSDHKWNESVNLYIKAADSLKVPVTVPFIGQPYTLGTAIQDIDWWNYF
jgi:L-ascorbate metabolism protein UlaG (beta-lactamase superfamily)